MLEIDFLEMVLSKFDKQRVLKLMNRGHFRVSYKISLY
jgi:hypothetical protein